MDATALLGLAVLAPLVSGVLTLFLPRGAIVPRVWLAVLGPAVSCALLGWHMAGAGVTPITEPAGTPSWPFWPTLNLNFAFLADGLGLFFAFLVAGIGVLITLYARAYFGPEKDDLYRFYPTLGFFTTAMLGIVLADYVLLTLLFWEMTSISSFLLIGWDRFDKKAVKLAMQAFFTTGLGGLVMLGGILLFGLHTDIWRWSELIAAFHGGELALATAAEWTNPIMWAFLLIFFGAATKSAQFPFHYWLPGAMAAPTPVSAFLHSATMVKAGVFLVGRMFPVFAVMEIWPWLIIPLGAVTMVLGAGLALNQHDLKRIFAYTTVSQLGLLMCVYGLGAVEFEYQGQMIPAIDFDISQVANHAFYKAPLFIVAGALGHVASRQLPELFGAVKDHPAMVVTILLAGYGLAAGPGTISFQAKELFLYAIYHAADHVHPAFWVLMGMAVLAAIFNVAIFIRLATTLLGLGPGLRPDPHAHDHDDHHHEHHQEHGLWGAMLWLPAAVLLIPQFVGGIYTPAWNAVFGPLETNFGYFAQTGVPALWELALGVPLMMSGLAIVGGIALGLSPLMRGAVVDPHDAIYPAMYSAAVDGGGKAFGLVQTGYLRHYIIFTLGGFLIALGGAVLLDLEPMLGHLAAEWQRVGEFWPGVILAVIACLTAVAIPMAQARVVRVLLLGACGFTVVGLYLVYEAPDLALTQLMFEIISVILFVLVLRLLPDAAPRVKEWSVGAMGWRLAAAVVMGGGVGLLTLVAASGTEGHQPLYAEYPRLGEFFLRHAHEGSWLSGDRDAGGGNVVNVVLVDFRGFDTLGEIAVLALAAIGVWSMMPRRWRVKA